MKIPSMFRSVKKAEERIPSTKIAKTVPKTVEDSSNEPKQTATIINFPVPEDTIYSTSTEKPGTVADILGVDVEDCVILTKMSIRDLVAHICESIVNENYGNVVYSEVEERLNPLGITFAYILNKDLEYDREDNQLYIISTMNLQCVSALGNFHMTIDLTSFQLCMDDLPRRTEGTTLGQSVIVRYFDELCTRANINDKCTPELAKRIQEFLEISKKSQRPGTFR